MPDQSAEIQELQRVVGGIQQRFSAFYASALEPYDISHAQFAVLVCLAEERRKMSDVARMLHVSLPAVTHLVNRLVRKRMVSRHPHATDRRVTLLELTVRGREVVAKTRGRTLKILTRAALAHSRQEQKAIRAFFGLLQAGLDKAIGA